MKKTFVTIGITVFVVGIVLFGTAYLALAQGDNIINACVAKDGSMRIVAVEEQCKNKETPLSWNKQGEPGPVGVLGFYTVTSEVEVPGTSLGFGTTARCDIGDVVTGGGHHYILYENGKKSEVGFNSNAAMTNRPEGSEVGLGEGWTVRVWVDSPGSNILEVFAICADLTP
jgi:hypothetical protein